MKLLLSAFCLTLVFCLVMFSQDMMRVDAQIIDLPIPDYPAAARATRLVGQVRANVEINEEGNVTKVLIVTGPDFTCPQVERLDVVSLREAAREAALRAKFSPALLDGKAVVSTRWINFDFTAEVAANSADRDPGSKTGTISGGVLNGKAMALEKPIYPPAARAVRASGAVSIQVLIDIDGSVLSAEPVSGHPLLLSEARMAACKSRFTPTLLEGTPVKVSGIITYSFVP
jgi:TonB family protein